MSKENAKVLNDHELGVVPLTGRRSLWSIVAVLMCWIINPTPAIVGGSVANGMTLTNALLAIFVGALVLGLYAYPIGIAGSREGISTAMLSRFTFGDKGANIVSLAMGIANVIFYGVVVGVFVVSMEGVFGAEPGSFAVWGGILFAMIMGTSSFFGYKGVALLSSISILPMLGLFIYSAILGINKGGGWSAIVSQPIPAEQIPFVTGITMTIGIFAVGATLVSDVTRYSKPGKIAGLAVILSFCVGFFVFVSLGAIAVKGTGAGDLIKVIISAGGPFFMWIGFLLLFVSSWTSGDNNVYSAGLAFSKMFKLPKYIFTIITVATGAIIAASGVYNNLFAYLGILAMLIPPIGSILSIDYFFVKRNVKDRAKSIKPYNMIAIISWATAVVVDLLTANQLFGDYVFGKSIGISGINSLVIGGVLYFVLTLIYPEKVGMVKPLEVSQ
ncbi:MAG: hypothetical protein A2Y21_02465 [Clostridiales bacterium GWC2_40_7]|nr:MAG: hypothetical protein A2Y21_02465 [Clostridiales bacterium GWC2_40_7]